MRPSATVLTVNPGSSSLKVSLRTPQVRLSMAFDRLGTARGSVSVSSPDGEEKRQFVDGPAAAVDAVAVEVSSRGPAPTLISYRVVHGGPQHYRPTPIDDRLVSDLQAVIPLAPLHLPGALDAIGHGRRTWPHAQHIACFDTGFHHDLPEVSRRLPVADDLVDLGVRRYGFHGLSVQSVVDTHPDLGPAVIAHLGSGCSVTAVADGRSVHTTMSLTPTSGMVSATRSGDLDPEIVLYLIEHHGYRPDDLRQSLDHRSGLAGIAGGRHDVRDLLDAQDDDARLALDVFVASAAMAIASCATRLDPWQTLVFTGGVGEHSSAIRTAIGRRLLSVRGASSDTDHTGPGGERSVVDRLAATGLRVLVVSADEEAVLDRLARTWSG